MSKKLIKKKDKKLLRKYRVCIKFNEKELKVINKFCRKYKIKNKSQFFREAIIKTIVSQMVDNDYPKLFQDLIDQQTIDTKSYTQPQDESSKQEERKVQEINPPKLF